MQKYTVREVQPEAAAVELSSDRAYRAHSSERLADDAFATGYESVVHLLSASAARPLPFVVRSPRTDRLPVGCTLFREFFLYFYRPSECTLKRGGCCTTAHAVYIPPSLLPNGTQSPADPSVGLFAWTCSGFKRERRAGCSGLKLSLRSSGDMLWSESLLMGYE